MGEKVPENILRRLSEAATLQLQYDLERGATRWSEYCESPIEILFLSAFTLGYTIVDWAHDSGVPHVARQSELSDLITRSYLVIVPQFVWQEYRIDFAIFDSERLDSPLVFIECDGHSFHERTPEQAERDRRRDREIQLAGIPITRFTGREIYRDPFRCVEETITFATNRMGKENGRAPNSAA